MIVNQRRPNAWDHVGTNRRPHATTANRHSPFHLSCCYGVRKRDDVVRIVIAGIQFMSTEIDDFVGCRAELGDKLFFQRKPAVIGSDPYEHVLLPSVAGSPPGSCRYSMSSRESFSGCCRRDSALIVIRP